MRAPFDEYSVYDAEISTNIVTSAPGDGNDVVGVQDVPSVEVTIVSGPDANHFPASVL
jgi:hypothetical protein